MPCLGAYIWCTLSLCDLLCFGNFLMNIIKEVIKEHLKSQVIIKIRKMSYNNQVSIFSNMVLEIRCKKEIEDHKLVGTMLRIMKKGFNFLGNLTISIKNYILKVISKLVRK